MTRHDSQAVLFPEFQQAGEWFRIVRSDGWPEVQIRRNGHWWPVHRCLE